jgi:hypothetical protein
VISFGFELIVYSVPGLSKFAKLVCGGILK